MRINKIIGIYCIENLINNKKYIGKGLDIIGRWNSHKFNLKNNKHVNNYLQNAWNKYGENNFKFYIIKKCEREELIKKEIYYIKKFNTKSPNGYNLTDGGEGSLGWIPSQETKENIRKALFGKNLSEERKLRMKVPKKRSSNIKYKSIYRGVSFKNEKYWRASLKLNNKSIHIGIYDTEIDAAKAYDEYIINNNLPHPLNFPEDYPNRGAINNDS